jgi:alkaline phosphatase
MFMAMTIMNEKNLERKIQLAHMGDVNIVEYSRHYFEKGEKNMKDCRIFKQSFTWITILAAIGMNIVFFSAVMAAERAKNIIVLIADGCSSEQYTFVRWYKGAALSFDDIQVGAVRTYIADSVVADSAPAASAYATGVRTSDKFISAGPHKNTLSSVPIPDEALQYRPLATVLEGARLMKKATGVVSTSRVSHATPGAYISHSASRSLEHDMMEQAVYQNIDVVFGGGKELLLPKDANGKRPDGENLLSVLRDQGYQIAETREDLSHIKYGKVFGMFADNHMDAEIDRTRNHPSQPTLREMTEKAIDILSQDKNGFFLMVEGSQIDWACHANDPAHLLGDMLAYDQAVQAALDFARKDGRTLLIALSDHNTGGFSIGNAASNKNYSQMKQEDLLKPFNSMKSTATDMWRKIKDNETSENVIEIVQSDWGMAITTDDASAILKLAEIYKNEPFYAFGEFLSAKYTFAGWTTHGHCGGDVPLFAFGPGKPAGLLEAPEIATVCARSMGLNLNRLNQRLFVDASMEFDSVIVDVSQPENPVAQITFQGKIALLPINKNLLEMNNKLYRLEGVVVYAAATQKVYIPCQAVQLIKGIKKNLPSLL